MLMSLRRYAASSLVINYSPAIPSIFRFQSSFSESNNNNIDDDEEEVRPRSLPVGLHLSPLFWQDNSPLTSSEIKVVDFDAWLVSSSLVQVSKNVDCQSDKRLDGPEQMSCTVAKSGDEPDFDDIEDMRIRGNLFYQIDRGSKEFEESKFDFHRRKSRPNDDASRDSKSPQQCHLSVSNGQKSLKSDMGHNGKDKNGSNQVSSLADLESISRIIKDKYVVCASQKDTVPSYEEKKRRSPTFNHLTGPYHEPFCLDIYISKASVRASVIHRVTSKVVSVAHSISKDIKFDLNSTRNATACSAVGKLLAERALADDIHDVIFTPRKGDRLEGKLQIVLQAIMSSGINVKVKLKHRNVKKAGSQIPAENQVSRA